MNILQLFILAAKLLFKLFIMPSPKTGGLVCERGNPCCTLKILDYINTYHSFSSQTMMVNIECVRR